MEPICERLRDLRIRSYGPRGKSAFARDLGLPVTSYVHYENDRAPPADVLLRVARLTRVRLEWLISGEGPREESADPPPTAPESLGQIVRLLERHPELEASLPGLIDSLEKAAAIRPRRPKRSRSDAPDRRGWIPVIGSTAAGTARFWSELPSPRSTAEIDRRLADLVAGSRPSELETVSGASTDDEAAGPATLVQCSQPDDRGIVEFVAAGAFKRRYPRAVAWRIDGDSMEPRYRDGDLVLITPDEPALEGQPCIARQKGQIGVNCKLYRPEGRQVLLIPINERYPAQRVPTNRLEWAYRVLGVLRLAR